MSVNLTRRQRDLYAFIRAYIAKHETAPSYDEMAAGIGLRSKGRICEMVDGLVERGVIVRLPNRVRTIALVDQPALPADLEQRVAAYCRRIGITRPVFDQRAAESLLRGRA